MPNKPPTHRPRGWKPREFTERYQIARDIRSSKSWQSVRWSVLQGEPFCRLCRTRGITTVAEHGHHIESVTDRPDLALDADNVCPLCVECHEKVHRGQVDKDKLRRKNFEV